MRTYNELTLEERVEIQQRLESGDTLRAIGRSLDRAASTISRECRRAGAKPASYKAQAAQQRSQRCRTKPRVTRKLDDPALWETVQALLRARWSPEQIAGYWREVFLTQRATGCLTKRSTARCTWCLAVSCARS
jgi:IS30 family transposase